MKLKVMKILIMFAALALLVEAVTSDDHPRIALPGCNSSCGGIPIPYPFGIGYSTTQDHTPCSLDSKFNLTCQNNELIRGKNLRVQEINLQGQMVLSFFVSHHCSSDGNPLANKPFLETSSYTISSTENKFITVGCDSFGYLNSHFDNATYSTGCLTRCYNYDLEMVIGNNTGKCTGLGCCQVDIPQRMKDITIQAYQFPNSSQKDYHCSYSFIAKQGSYNFSKDDINKLPNRTFPLVVNWAVTDVSCETARTTPQYACKENSDCVDKDSDSDGYRCKCSKGFQGNPYLPGGCIDIDECKNGTVHDLCKTNENCNNTAGSYTCTCPYKITEGGCQKSRESKIEYGVGAALILLFAATFSYLIYHKRKFIKLKEKLFEQNGGLFLRQKLSANEYSSSQSTQIFTHDELKKATKNFDESLIIGRGGFGTVFKGLLADKRVVAIKKSKLINKNQTQQFIDEVVVLSQINHRNVVKLLGCCLETKVPLLVYEFVSNGTLSNFIHKKLEVNNETWKTRLKIAAEVAGALSHLHSGVTIPIIHSDVKSDNVLLDETNTARVSDFGASKLVPLDQTQVATMVQGTFGYLDPEYMQTGQLTDKSDVYSFGVVLVELLTGEKPFCFGGQENNRSLAMHFLSYLKRDDVFKVIQNGMWNEENKQEIKEVSVLASKCLRLRGEERPSMKEVALELEGMSLMHKQSWINDDINIEESQYLLCESSSSIYEPGDRSKHGDVGYDSLKDQELIVLDNGR